MAEGKLIAALAFDIDETGQLYPIGEGQQCMTETQAKARAAALASRHAGAIAWSRPANPLAGEYGEPTVIARFGRVPESLE